MLKITHTILLNIRCSVTSMKQIYPFFFCLLIPLVLPGCNNLSPKDTTNEGAAAQEVSAETSAKVSTEAAPTIDAAADSVPPQKEVKLDGDTLFNLLAAEFAGNNGDVDASLEYYREASKTIQDSRIAARTAYIALYGENYEEAERLVGSFHLHLL